MHINYIIIFVMLFFSTIEGAFSYLRPAHFEKKHYGAVAVLGVVSFVGFMAYRSYAARRSGIGATPPQVPATTASPHSQGFSPVSTYVKTPTEKPNPSVGVLREIDDRDKEIFAMQDPHVRPYCSAEGNGRLPCLAEHIVQPNFIGGLVPEAAFAVYSAIRRRELYEDRFTIQLIQPNIYLFGVFDGHGGFRAAEYVAQRLPYFLRENTELADKQAIEDEKVLEAALRSAVSVVQQRMQNSQITLGGTTATVALVTPQHICIGHLGDSAAYFLGTNPTSIMKGTDDHNMCNAEEATRIHKLEKNIDSKKYKVEGASERLYLSDKKTTKCVMFAVTRHLGYVHPDRDPLSSLMDTSGLISSEPAIRFFPMASMRQEGHRYMLLVTDGITNGFQYPESSISELVQQNASSSLGRCVEQLVSQTTLGGDNATALIVDLHRLFHSQ